MKCRLFIIGMMNISFLLLFSCASRVDYILWNKLGSDTEVIKSKIGVNGVRFGGDFKPGKFGNGFLSKQTNEYVLFKNAIPLEEGTIECWVKPYWDGTTNGTTRYGVFGDSQGSHFYLYWSQKPNNCWIFRAGNVEIGFPGSSSHKSNDNVHLAMAWSKKVLIGYVNGKEVVRTQADINLNPVDLEIGRLGGQLLTFYGVIDNLKIYDHIKTNFNLIKE